MHEKNFQVLNHHLLLRHQSQHDNVNSIIAFQNHSGGIPAESLRSKQLSGIPEGRINLDHHRRASLEFEQIKAPSPAPFSLLRFWSPVSGVWSGQISLFQPIRRRRRIARRSIGGSPRSGSGLLPASEQVWCDFGSTVTTTYGTVVFSGHFTSFWPTVVSCSFLPSWCAVSTTIMTKGLVRTKRMPLSISTPISIQTTVGLY